VDIVGGGIVRESDGLAMSSRNQYLDASERPRAGEIHQTLLQMRGAVEEGREIGQVEVAASARLAGAGFEVDYAVVRRPDLSIAHDGGAPKVALIAARLGRTRLIDNLEW